MMATSGVEHDEVIAAIIAMLKTTLQEAIACAPSSGVEVIVNLGPPLPNGDRDWDTKITRRNRYKYRRTPSN